jgi:hypothetical protein
MVSSSVICPFLILAFRNRVSYHGGGCELAAHMAIAASEGGVSERD